MARAHANRYTLLGYLVWQVGKWHLRRRLPSQRALALGGLGALAACIAAFALARRLSA
ncbi:MAG TPA: hypothetical protein VMF09_09650 [Solirubrobacteraceae bacterium]|nr:hypothetical protein [Solirubrobacteraceae bacterium]